MHTLAVSGVPVNVSGPIRDGPASSSLDMQFGRLGQGDSLPSVMPSGLLPCEAQDTANIAKKISAGISKYMLVFAISS